MTIRKNSRLVIKNGILSQPQGNDKIISINSKGVIRIAKK